MPSPFPDPPTTPASSASRTTGYGLWAMGYGTTAVASISTLARSSTSAVTCNRLMAG